MRVYTTGKPVQVSSESGRRAMTSPTQPASFHTFNTFNSAVSRQM